MRKNEMILFITAGIFTVAASGCYTTETGTPEEPALAASEHKTLTDEDIITIEQQDTSGRVSAAREAANKLIADARTEAERIRREADKIMAAKKAEAEKKAAEIVSSMTAEQKKQKEELIKQYMSEKKKEVEDTARAMLDKAKKNADNIKAEASEYAKSLKSKYEKQADEISARLIENARKASADITANAQKQAESIKADADKIVEDAKKYTEKQKKAADEYLAKKMEDADKSIAKLTDKLKGSKKSSNENVKPVLANATLDNILKAMNEDNCKMFTEKFTTELKENFTEEKFKTLNEQLRKKIGTIQSREYLGCLVKGPITVYLWKATFSEATNNDLIIRLTMSKLDGKDQVFAFDISNL